MLDRLLKLKNTYESATTEEVSALSEYFLNKEVSGCSNCFKDAIIELINYSKKMEKQKSIYGLVAGVVLEDDNKDLQAHTDNLTDELAVYHLRKDSTLIRFFYQFPKDWEKQIKKAVKEKE